MKVINLPVLWNKKEKSSYRDEFAWNWLLGDIEYTEQVLEFVLTTLQRQEVRGKSEFAVDLVFLANSASITFSSNEFGSRFSRMLLYNGRGQVEVSVQWIKEIKNYIESKKEFSESINQVNVWNYF